MYKEYTSHDELVSLVTSAYEHALKSIRDAYLSESVPWIVSHLEQGNVYTCNRIERYYSIAMAIDYHKPLLFSDGCDLTPFTWEVDTETDVLSQIEVKADNIYVSYLTGHVRYLQQLLDSHSIAYDTLDA